MRGTVLHAGIATVLLAGMAWAGPGDGIKAGPVVLHPFADVSVTHDSNVFQAPRDREADVYAQGAAGLRFLYSSLRFSLIGSGHAGARRYMDESDLDFDFAGQSLGAAVNGERTALTLSQSYRRVEDIDLYGSEFAVGGISQDSILDVASRRERDILQASLALDRRLTDKLDLTLGGRYETVEYNDGALQDLRSAFGLVEGAFRMTPKTALFLAGTYGQMDGKNEDGTAIGYAGRLGLKTIGTDKLVFRAGVGAQVFDPQDGGEDRTALSFDGSATWAATEKVFVQAGARNGLSKSILAANEGVEYSVYRLGLLARASDMVTLSLSGAYRLDEYLDSDREDAGIGVRARVDFASASDALRAYWETSYENVDSNEDERDYRKLRITLGMNLKY